MKKWLAQWLRRFGNRLRGVRRKTWMLLAIVLGTATISTALVAFAPEPDRRPVAETAVPVASLTAVTGTWSPEADLYGRVETPHAARLTALVAATVDALRAREGDRVAAGDVLVQLDETDARLLLRRRQSDLAEARADLEALKLAGSDDRDVLEHQQALHQLALSKVKRYRQLRAQGSISQETLNAVVQDSHAQAIALSRQHNQVQSFEHRLARAEARVTRAEASVEEAGVGLDRTRIRAPFPGRVTRIAVAPGELVSPGGVVAEIYDDSNLEIRVQIPNAHLPVLGRALAAGRTPRASVDFGAWRASGELDRIKGAVGKGQSGVDGLVRLHPGQPTPDLGRAVRLRITLPPLPDVVAVPMQAVYGQRRLFLIEDDLLLGIDVERLGKATDADGQLKLLVRAEELADGTRYLSSQLSNAVTGLRVKVVEGASDESRLQTALPASG